MDLDKEISKLMGWESVDCEGSTLWGVWEGDLFRVKCSITKGASDDTARVLDAAVRRIAELEAENVDLAITALVAQSKQAIAEDQADQLAVVADALAVELDESGERLRKRDKSLVNARRCIAELEAEKERLSKTLVEVQLRCGNFPIDSDQSLAIWELVTGALFPRAAD